MCEFTIEYIAYIKMQRTKDTCFPPLRQTQHTANHCQRLKSHSLIMLKEGPQQIKARSSL